MPLRAIQAVQPFHYWRNFVKILLKNRKQSDFGGIQSTEVRGKKV
jgi:hypothetical protein